MAHHACTALRLRLRLRLLQLTGSCGLVQQRSDRHRADAPRSGGDVAAAPLQRPPIGHVSHDSAAAATCHAATPTR
jgi:hypothetical protein